MLLDIVVRARPRPKAIAIATRRKSTRGVMHGFPFCFPFLRFRPPELGYSNILKSLSDDRANLHCSR